MAEKANITPYILRWARESARITEEILSNISKEVFQNQGELFLAARTFGISSFLLQVNRNSRLVTRHILDAYRGGFIEPSIASQLFNVQVNKFQKLEAQEY